jgi:hypothetical protein
MTHHLNGNGMNAFVQLLEQALLRGTAAPLPCKNEAGDIVSGRHERFEGLQPLGKTAGLRTLEGATPEPEDHHVKPNADTNGPSLSVHL